VPDATHNPQQKASRDHGTKSVVRNEFVARGGHAVIFAPHKGTFLHEVTVDVADLERVLAAGFWRVVNVDSKTPRLYAYCHINLRVVYLHRFVMDAPADLMVDHRNHDGLDDRRSNLTVCTHAQNMLNRKGAAANSKSGFRGVDWYAHRGKWRARVRTKGKSGLIGYFKTPEAANEAVQARLREMEAQA
jgi:hypothetical protein